jgi:ribosomal protein S18 acetylase RimI-like enzyme
MIRLITRESAGLLQSFCEQAEQAPFACKISSTAAAYGTELPFAQFWLQVSDENIPVAAVSKLDDALTIYTTQGSDNEELKELIAILNVKSVLCDFSAAQAISLPIAQQGEIMVYHNQNHLSAPDFENDPNLEEVHKLLCACKTDSFTPPEFEPFYLDLSHRVRHGTARVVGIRSKNTLVSCAMTVAQTANRAVISAVATHPAYQRQGFGRQAVCALISQLPQNELLIFRTQHENAVFYRSLGFEPYGEWAELQLDK